MDPIYWILGKWGSKGWWGWITGWLRSWKWSDINNCQDGDYLDLNGEGVHFKEANKKTQQVDTCSIPVDNHATEVNEGTI